MMAALIKNDEKASEVKKNIDEYFYFYKKRNEDIENIKKDTAK